MRKVHLICSLLMAFCVSIFGMGCDSPKPAAPGAAPKMTGEPPKADPAAKKTSKKKKTSGDGSTTGGGVEVPAAGGTAEKAPEAAPETKAEEAKPEETKPEEAKTEEKKPE